MTSLRLVCVLGAAWGLSACGGGGGSPGDTADPVVPQPPVADQTVPASALVDAASFVRFVMGLPPSESAEPLDVATAQPPLADSAEPLPFN